VPNRASEFVELVGVIVVAAALVPSQVTPAPMLHHGANEASFSCR
jgi:hypothetical protein